ncbi:hypothetical protein O3P69_017101 [Scylla paramamosain]|uniref:C2H2-type domain-containing protein n=1 Tax=Scylla paramamosain TaxID=85552 RepID=A0AAW0TTT9_SCYPA
MEVATRPSHDGAPEYKCTYCDRIMNRKSNMKRHIASIHTKVKHSSCCNAHFTTTAALRLHQKTVHENGYVCPTCGRTFERKASLDRHIFTHTTEKPFKCESCPYNTCSKFNLKRHARLKHSALPQVPVPQPEIQVPVPQPRPEAPEENQQYSQAQEGPALALHQGMPDTRDIAHRPVAPHHAVEESLHPFREESAFILHQELSEPGLPHQPGPSHHTLRYSTPQPGPSHRTLRDPSPQPGPSHHALRYQSPQPDPSHRTLRDPSPQPGPSHHTLRDPSPQPDPSHHTLRDPSPQPGLSHYTLRDPTAQPGPSYHRTEESHHAFGHVSQWLTPPAEELEPRAHYQEQEVPLPLDLRRNSPGDINAAERHFPHYYWWPRAQGQPTSDGWVPQWPLPPYACHQVLSPTTGHYSYQHAYPAPHYSYWQSHDNNSHSAAAAHQSQEWSLPREGTREGAPAEPFSDIQSQSEVVQSSPSAVSENQQPRSPDDLPSSPASLEQRGRESPQHQDAVCTSLDPSPPPVFQEPRQDPPQKRHPWPNKDYIRSHVFSGSV